MYIVIGITTYSITQVFSKFFFVLETVHTVDPMTLGPEIFKIIKSFFMVYQMACKTIFICFLEDERRNDGSKSRPYAMSVELYKLLTTVQRPKRKRPITKKKPERMAPPKTKPIPGSLTRIHKNRSYISVMR